jgi:next-to-BRCA1 protein 1
MSRQTLAMLLTAGVESFSSVTSLEETKPSPSESPSLPSKPKTPQAVVVGLPITFIEPTEERKSVTPIPKAEPEPVEEEPVIVTMDEAKPKIYLSAMFVEDSIVSDGQVFPPGAEFMKCWRMLNDSEHDWPEKTQLMYVAGETLGVKKDGAVHVGAVKPGTEVELWTGELKVRASASRRRQAIKFFDLDSTFCLQTGS